MDKGQIFQSILYNYVIWPKYDDLINKTIRETLNKQVLKKSLWFIFKTSMTFHFHGQLKYSGFY